MRPERLWQRMQLSSGTCLTTSGCGRFFRSSSVAGGGTSLVTVLRGTPGGST